MRLLLHQLSRNARAVARGRRPSLAAAFVGSSSPHSTKTIKALIGSDSAPSASSITYTLIHSQAGQRPFRVLGIQQIAIGGLDKKVSVSLSGIYQIRSHSVRGLDKKPLLTLWSDVLGVEKIGSFRSEKENVDEDILKLGKGPWAVEVDLMQPINPDKAPKVHVPPLNHIGLWVDPLKDAYEYLSDKGVRFTPGGVRKGAASYDVCFIHPKRNTDKPLSGEGVLIELVQAPPEVIEAFNKKA